MLLDIVEDLPRFFIITSLTTTLSYTVATAAGKNALLAAKIAAISTLVVCLFRDCVEYYANRADEVRNLLYIIGTTNGGAALISALYNHEMINGIGVAILGGALLLANTVISTLHMQGHYVYA